MSRIATYLMVVVGVVVVFAVAFYGRQYVYATPVDTTRAYYQAMATGDERTLLGLTCQANRDVLRSQIAQDGVTHTTIYTLGAPSFDTGLPSFVPQSEVGNSAVVIVAGNGKTSGWPVHLTRESTFWRICEASA